MREQRLDVAGIAMRWLEQGEGAPVVLLHGIPTSPRLWRHVVPHLDGVRALAWEMVGYGDSWQAGASRDISVRAQAAYLLDWLDALAIERALLVGHDLGGGVAQIAAVRRPDRCAGLVLTNSIGYDSWPIPMVKALAALSGIVARLPRPALRALLAGFIKPGHDSSERARSRSVRTCRATTTRREQPRSRARRARSTRRTRSR